MGYTSKYAENAMNKAVGNGEPKKGKKKKLSVSDKKRIIKDPQYRAHLKKQKKEKIANMSPNDPNF